MADSVVPQAPPSAQNHPDPKAHPVVVFLAAIVAGVGGGWSAAITLSSREIGLLEKKLDARTDPTVLASELMNNDNFKRLVSEGMVSRLRDSNEFTGRVAGSLLPEVVRQIREAALEEARAGVPVGTVIAWPFASPPAGDRWLICDGKVYAKRSRPLLFAAMEREHFPYEQGTETKDSFKVPDYRGYFLRGLSSDSGRDPDRVLGKPQADATREGVARVTRRAVSGIYHAQKAPENDRYGWIDASVLTLDGHRGSTVEETITMFPNGSETRPKNVSVLWLINAGEPEQK